MSSNKRYPRVMLDVKVGTDRSRSQLQISRDKYLDGTFEPGIDIQNSGKLAASETYAVPFGKIVTGKMILIESTGDMEVRFNGAGTGPTLKLLPLASMHGLPAPLARLYAEMDVTSLSLVNPSSTKTVEFNVYVLGVGA